MQSGSFCRGSGSVSVLQIPLHCSPAHTEGPGTCFKRRALWTGAGDREPNVQVVKVDVEGDRSLTLRHTQPGVAERFIEDLKAAVTYVQLNPDEAGEMAPVYGLAATMPLRGVVNDMLKRYIDLLYEV